MPSLGMQCDLLYCRAESTGLDPSSLCPNSVKRDQRPASYADIYTARIVPSPVVQLPLLEDKKA